MNKSQIQDPYRGTGELLMSNLCLKRAVNTKLVITGPLVSQAKSAT